MTQQIMLRLSNTELNIYQDGVDQIAGHGEAQMLPGSPQDRIFCCRRSISGKGVA
ncbi:hypothetical protein [Rhizobium sophoriradicis]|uniref:hypothetical protein n=1 Tax=Rhizobium sophoriradicis TaxID=1535245 RepID=UPI001483077C|nr:hypothetical protein [Rhizobium sophoriradicis]